MINKNMQERSLILYEIDHESGGKEYILSEEVIPNGKPLATYKDISELYHKFYVANGTYNPSSFSTSSGVGNFYATTPTRTVSDAARHRIGAANSVHQKGEGNSQYGTRWIYSDEEKRSKKIRATDDIPPGWKLGRKIKFDDEEQ